MVRIRYDRKRKLYCMTWPDGDVSGGYADKQEAQWRLYALLAAGVPMETFDTALTYLEELRAIAPHAKDYLYTIAQGTWDFTKPPGKE